MKVIIAGSRHMADYTLLKQDVKASKFKIDAVVCGMAKGADLLGKRWVEENKIPVKEFPADWNKYGKSAGPIRNGEMAKYADAAIIFIYAGSRGSENMLTQITRQKKPVFVVRDGVI